MGGDEEGILSSPSCGIRLGEEMEAQASVPKFRGRVWQGNGRKRRILWCKMYTLPARKNRRCSGRDHDQGRQRWPLCRQPRWQRSRDARVSFAFARRGGSGFSEPAIFARFSSVSTFLSLSSPSPGSSGVRTTQLPRRGGLLSALEKARHTARVRPPSYRMARFLTRRLLSMALSCTPAPASEQTMRTPET